MIDYFYIGKRNLKKTLNDDYDPFYEEEYEKYRPQKDTVIPFKKITRMPIHKRKYLEISQTFFLSNKICNEFPKMDSFYKTYLDSLTQLYPILKERESPLKSYYTILFIDKYKSKYKSSMNLHWHALYYYYSKMKNNKIDSIVYKANIQNMVFKDTMFAYVVAKIPSDKDLYDFMSSTMISATRYLKTEKDQVQIGLQLLKLLEKCDPVVKKKIYSYYLFLCVYINFSSTNYPIESQYTFLKDPIISEYMKKTYSH